MYLKIVGKSISEVEATGYRSIFNKTSASTNNSQHNYVCHKRHHPVCYFLFYYKIKQNYGCVLLVYKCIKYKYIVQTLKWCFR